MSTAGHSEISEASAAGSRHVFDLGGFEGPLDLLLELARDQKVDLLKISMLDLANQYIGIIEDLLNDRLELAADYLVMAAWLTYLKSRLLLPKQEKDDGPDAEELAEILKFRLKRLDAIRHRANLLNERDRLGQDFFARGSPEDLEADTVVAYEASLYDFLAAYGGIQARSAPKIYEIRVRDVVSLSDARSLLSKLVGKAADWMPLDLLASAFPGRKGSRISRRASAFAASLELVKDGEAELQQAEAMGPVYIRKTGGGI